MDCVAIVFSAILVHYGVICNPQESRRFLFDQTPGQTTPDPSYLAAELKYMRDQLHGLGDKNIELSVQNAMLSSQVQHQNQVINSLKVNATNLEKSHSLEKSALNDKINELQIKLNGTNITVTQMMSNISSCISHRQQLENTLMVSRVKVDVLGKKLNDSMAVYNSLNTSLEQCKKNETSLVQQLHTTSSIRQNCSHQNTMLNGQVNHLQAQLNGSTSLIQKLESNWTMCLKHTSQLEDSLNVSQARNHLLEKQLNGMTTDRNNLSSALSQCHQMANNCGLDLVFLVDESGSVGDYNFFMFKDFIYEIVQGLKIGGSDVQVGVVTYATTPKAEFYLNTYSDKASLLNAVQNISYTHPGLSITSRGFRFVAENLFNSTNGDRPGYPNTLVLLTDGRPLLPSVLKQEAEKLQNQSVDIFVVGVSKEVDRQTMIEITKDSTHVQTFADFGGLDNRSAVRDFVNILMTGCRNMDLAHSLLKDPKIVSDLQSMICKN